MVDVMKLGLSVIIKVSGVHPIIKLYGPKNAKLPPSVADALT